MNRNEEGPKRDFPVNMVHVERTRVGGLRGLGRNGGEAFVLGVMCSLDLSVEEGETGI